MMSATHRSSPAFAIGGVSHAFACIGCGAEVFGLHFLDVRGICPKHCFDHDYEYDRYERRHLCIHCEEEQEWEPSEDDVCASGPGCGEPLGTPLSEVAGRPDGTVAGQARYERFCRIAESWGQP